MQKLLTITRSTTEWQGATLSVKVIFTLKPKWEQGVQSKVVMTPV